MVNDMVCTSMKVGEIAEWQTVRFSEPKINKFNNVEKTEVRYMGKRKTREDYIDELAIKNPTVKLVGEYINNRTPTTHYCEIHNIYWDISPNNALCGKGCKKCCSERIGKALRKSEAQYVQELALSNPTIKLVGTYIDANTPTEHYCEIHKVASEITPYNALHGAGCVKCHFEKIANQKRKQQDEYIAELSIKNPTVKLVGTYINARTPIAHYCEIHQIIWNISPCAALQGQGCQQCKNERIGDALKKSKEQYINELSIIHPNIVLCGEYLNANTPTPHRCLIHDYEWCPTPGNILSGHGCSKCNESKGELQITLWLQQNKMIGIAQKRFCDCCDIKPLPFDFYIPELNVCIEYQGEQHYRPINFGGISDEDAYNNFLITQRHDEIKRNYCIKNNIKLICVPYWENVDKYLNQNLLI